MRMGRAYQLRMTLASYVNNKLKNPGVLRRNFEECTVFAVFSVHSTVTLTINEKFMNSYTIKRQDYSF